MFTQLLKYGVLASTVFLVKIDRAVAEPFRYVGLGAGINVHGNNHGTHSDFHSDGVNVQGILRVQLPISNNFSASSNFLYLKDDPNLLISANFHLNPQGAVQPRLGVGGNIVLHNADRGDAGILGDRSSPILNIGLDLRLSKRWVIFGDAYYAITGNGGDSGSIAIVTGVGVRF